MVKIENEILNTNSPSWTIWLAGPWKHHSLINHDSHNFKLNYTHNFFYKPIILLIKQKHTEFEIGLGSIDHHR
jgi:hypothetical protein